jgi:hypothetical protein
LKKFKAADQGPACISILPHACHTLRPPHLSSFGRPNIIWRATNNEAPHCGRVCSRISIPLS